MRYLSFTRFRHCLVVDSLKKSGPCVKHSLRSARCSSAPVKIDRMHLAVNPRLYSLEDFVSIKKGKLLDMLEEVYLTQYFNCSGDLALCPCVQRLVFKSRWRRPVRFLFLAQARTLCCVRGARKWTISRTCSFARTIRFRSLFHIRSAFKMNLLVFSCLSSRFCYTWTLVCLHSKAGV